MKLTVQGVTQDEIDLLNKLDGYPKIGVNARTGEPHPVLEGWENLARAGNPPPGVTCHFSQLDDLGVPFIRLLDTSTVKVSDPDLVKDENPITVATLDTKIKAAGPLTAELAEIR